MLREESVSAQLLETLKRLMSLSILNNHRLVGGTALALQIGHRISIDIDLFSNSKTNYTEVEKLLMNEFSNEIKVTHYINSPFGKGIAFLIHGIKTDIIDWKSPFHYKPVVENDIRMASKEEIIRMKLAIITSPPEYARYDKKDFTDLACLLDKYTISEMIEIYKQSNNILAHPDRIVLEAFQYAELADKKPNPNMLYKLPWDEVKMKIQKAIETYLNSKY